GLGALHGSDAGGKLLVDLAIVAVGDAHGDFLEAGQYIKLCQREAGDAADSYGMAHSHRVKPATAAWPAGGGAELDPFALSYFSLRAVQLGGKGAASDPRRVGLRGADDLVNMARPDTRAAPSS